MRLLIASLIIVANFLVAPATHAQKVVPRAEITDAAGDVNEFNGKGNSFDVVTLGLDSDGKNLIVNVTLAAETGAMASAAVELYIDADNNVKTGGATEWGPAGFEYVAEVGICFVVATGRICTGGTDEPVKLRHAATMVERFTGAAGDELDRALEMTVSHLSSPETPQKGKTITERIRYSDLGVKKGQTIRIAAREADGKDGVASFFPDVLLKLK